MITCDVSGDWLALAGGEVAPVDVPLSEDDVPANCSKGGIADELGDVPPPASSGPSAASYCDDWDVIGFVSLPQPIRNGSRRSEGM